MKHNCANCGRDNPGEATRCQECGAPFYSENPAQTSPSFKDWFVHPASPRLKWWLWFAAWAGVALAILPNYPSYIIAFPGFPLGLIAALPHGEEKAVMAWMMVVPIFAGWLPYVLLAWMMSRSRNRGRFVIIYIVFCLLLMVNVEGCRRTLEAVKGIR